MKKTLVTFIITALILTVCATTVQGLSFGVKITPSAINNLRQCRDDIDNLIYHNANSNVLSGDQIQSLSGLMCALSQLINEHEFRRNHRAAAKYIKNIISHITDWMDSDALAAMHFQQLLGTAEIPDNKK